MSETPHFDRSKRLSSPSSSSSVSSPCVAALDVRDEWSEQNSTADGDIHFHHQSFSPISMSSAHNYQCSESDNHINNNNNNDNNNNDNRHPSQLQQGSDSSNKRDSQKSAKSRGHFKTLSEIFDDSIQLNANDLAYHNSSDNIQTQLQFPISDTPTKSEYLDTDANDPNRLSPNTTYSSSTTSTNNSTTTGQKHRRLCSGGASNPPMAHRRLNSSGHAHFVDRRGRVNALPSHEIPRMASTSTDPKHLVYGTSDSHYQQSLPQVTSMHYTEPQHLSQSQYRNPAYDYEEQYQQRRHQYHQQQRQHQQHQTQEQDSYRPYPQYAFPPEPLNPPNPSTAEKHHKREDSAGLDLLSVAAYAFVDKPPPPSTTQAYSTQQEELNTSQSIMSTQEPIAAAHWLQNMRKSPLMDGAPVDWCDNNNNPDYTNQYHRRSLDKRSTGTLDDSYNVSPSEHGYQRPNSSGKGRWSDPLPASSSNAKYHENINREIPYQSYLSEQQSNHIQYPPPRTMRSSSHSNKLSNYPTQQYRSKGETYTDSTFPEATKYSAPPPHPLAPLYKSSNKNDQHQRGRFMNHPSYYKLSPPPQSSVPQQLLSYNERIETDEPLFAKKESMMRPNSLNDNNRSTSTSSGGFRLSPLQFVQSLYGVSPNASLRSSPTAYAPGNGRNPSPLERLERKQSGNMHHPGVSLSHATYNTFFNELEQSNSSLLRHHNRHNTLELLEDFSESFLSIPSTPPVGSYNEYVHHADPIVPETKNSQPPLSTDELAARSYRASMQPSQVENNMLCVPIKDEIKSNSYNINHESDDNKPKSETPPPLGISKRIRRKCLVENCNNRIVQGGRCITHGAKRKLCGHPGCAKHVKKAGMCSAHGPARKRCEVDGCEKVAVQGGRCISHGAKKKCCDAPNCTKQATINGMCKKHNDLQEGKSVYDDYNYGLSRLYGDSENDHIPTVSSSPPNEMTHQRGLSIFGDMATVDTIIASSNLEGNRGLI